MSCSDVKLDDLLHEWRNLTADIIVGKGFNYDLFKKIYMETYTIIQHLAYQRTVEKKYLQLLFFAKEFEATRFIKVNEEHNAATWLTREMFNDYFLCVCPQGKTPTMIDSKNVEHSYEEVDTLIYLIKNHL